MKLYRTRWGAVVQDEGRLYTLGSDASNEGWDALVRRGDLYQYLSQLLGNGQETSPTVLDHVLAPIGSQEVWAAGVTYYRSREARIKESQLLGAGDFYDRVYEADRPELFFKATPHRVVGQRAKIAIRDDSTWSVPEPELTLLLNPGGSIVGYTVGNDVSSRSIESENLLYLPQAKIWDRCCALGPCVLMVEEPLPASTKIILEIIRGGKPEFVGTTTLAEMKRDLASLVRYLFRNNSFPEGCYLLTGTGIVPPDSFTLMAEDEVRITITDIGTLVNTVG
jgi:2-dehydro-3-deoxy-D-arabinonate dehydratase